MFHQIARTTTAVVVQRRVARLGADQSTAGHAYGQHRRRRYEAALPKAPATVHDLDAAAHVHRSAIAAVSHQHDARFAPGAARERDQPKHAMSASGVHTKKPCSGETST